MATIHLFSTLRSTTSYTFAVGYGGSIYARKASRATDQVIFPTQKATYQQAGDEVIQDGAGQKAGDTVHQGTGREDTKSHRTRSTLKSRS